MGTETADWQGDGYRRWQRSADLPMLVLSVLLIPVLVVPFTIRHLPGAVRDADDALDYLIWGAFVVDYLARLMLARRRFASSGTTCPICCWWRCRCCVRYAPHACSGCSASLGWLRRSDS